MPAVIRLTDAQLPGLPQVTHHLRREGQQLRAYRVRREGVGAGDRQARLDGVGRAAAYWLVISLTALSKRK
jgi:hypothetical protein